MLCTWPDLSDRGFKGEVNFHVPNVSFNIYKMASIKGSGGVMCTAICELIVGIILLSIYEAYKVRKGAQMSRVLWFWGTKWRLACLRDIFLHK